MWSLGHHGHNDHHMNYDHNHHQVVLQHVDEENAYLCGYLKIKTLTDEYPEMVKSFSNIIMFFSGYEVLKSCRELETHPVSNVKKKKLKTKNIL